MSSGIVKGTRTRSNNQDCVTSSLEPFRIGLLKTFIGFSFKMFLFQEAEKEMSLNALQEEQRKVMCDVIFIHVTRLFTSTWIRLQ